MLAESLGMSRDVRAEEFEIEDEDNKEESPIVTGDDDAIVQGEDANVEEESTFDVDNDL